MKRHVFIISDGTGITAEALGHSLITQFGNIEFTTTTLPYIDNPEKANEVVETINATCQQGEGRALVFTTLVNPEIRDIITRCNGRVLDLFQAFLDPLEAELGTQSTYTIGKTHAIADSEQYNSRIDAINYSLSCDDGLGAQHYAKADVILIGVSRSGKTPTCLYLAIHFGVLAANYPLIEDDLFNSHGLPKALQAHKDKLFGLLITPERLQSIREKRLPNSQYASLSQCQKELATIKNLYQRENISYINSTSYSIEEISTKILAERQIERHFTS